MKRIEINQWKRKAHFEMFSRMEYPHYHVCADVELTNAYHFAKERGLSLFKVILYGVSMAANGVEELRTRIRGDHVVVHEMIHPSFTVLNQEELFGFAHMDHTPEASEFFVRAEQAILKAQDSLCLEDDPVRDDFLFVSCVPWIKFTSISHPIPNKPLDSIPRVVWGKVVESENKFMTPVALQAHHSLVDGLHMSRFFDGLAEVFSAPEEFLESK